jgi:hypothetical protein
MVDGRHSETGRQSRRTTEKKWKRMELTEKERKAEEIWKNVSEMGWVRAWRETVGKYPYSGARW